LCAALGAAAQPLPALKARSAGVTVSGVSSGAFMAVQFHVAHSASVAGAGALAGGPYYCAQGSWWAAYWNCMTPGTWDPLPATAWLMSRVEAFAAAGRIDSTKGLAGAPVWLFSGTRDRTVYPEVVKALASFYEELGSKVVLVADKPAGHAMITDGAGRACGTTEPPFMNDCSYDAAGELLQHLLGALNPPSAQAQGRLSAFDQAAHGLQGIGYVYVPNACTAGGCRVHVAFHGCRQGASEIGQRYVSEAGYNRWADTNALIVLYPQVAPSYWPRFNPRGCWDWWGYTGAVYATRDAEQMRAVSAMLAHLAQ
jgi:poly(3-hydroxybutyrate) depolymerase